MHEDMLCALSLPTKTTAAELFNSLDDYISGKLKWSFCVGICTDGAAAMTGRLSGLTASIKEVAPECESVPSTGKCWLAEKCHLNLLKDVVKIINHIKALVRNSRLFEQLREETNAEHRRLLLYT